MMYNDPSMLTIYFSNPENRQSGNALIYVLIAIALFASLSFVLGRQTDTSETGVVSEEQAELYASQLISYSAQAKSSVDQMRATGAYPEDLYFFLPGDTGFDDGATYKDIHKIFHPAGGGLSMKNLPSAIRKDDDTSEPGPAPGWYMGRFNNVEWTGSTANDVILVAYKITRPVCEAINEKITGSKTIPKLTGKARDFFIYDAASTPPHEFSTGGDHTGSNADFAATGSPAPCGDCDGMPSLCVSNDTEKIFAFYNIIAEG